MYKLIVHACRAPRELAHEPCTGSSAVYRIPVQHFRNNRRTVAVYIVTAQARSDITLSAIASWIERYALRLRARTFRCACCVQRLTVEQQQQHHIFLA